MPQDDSPQSPTSSRIGESSPLSAARAPRFRWAVRLMAIPLIGIVAALLYRGLHDRFFLPACDSERAKHTLADVLKQLKLEPSRYEPLTTVSSGNALVVCKAALPLPDSGKVVIDYSFYWQGSQANMRYSVTRQ